MKIKIVLTLLSFLTLAVLYLSFGAQKVKAACDCSSPFQSGGPGSACYGTNWDACGSTGCHTYPYCTCPNSACDGVPPAQPSCQQTGGACYGADTWVGDGSCGGQGVCSGGSCACGCGTVNCSSDLNYYRCSIDYTENKCNTEVKTACSSKLVSSDCSNIGCTWYSTSVCGPGQTCNQNSSCPNICGDSVSCASSCTPTTCAAQGVNCGTINDGCGGTLNCGTPTCTIGISPQTLTLLTGHSGSLGSSVTITSSCGSASSVSWTSSNPAIASVASPGTATTVTGVAPGTANISAAASLSPSGSCSTTSPAIITVVSAYFQTFGGDVTSKGAISNPFLPSGKYISGR